jgi:hypothetical protein
MTLMLGEAAALATQDSVAPLMFDGLILDDI